MEWARRDLFTLGAAGAIVSASSVLTADDTAPSAVEQRNANLVSDFCASWSTLDVNKIASFLDDKLIYQISEGLPLIKGKEAFIKLTGPNLTKMERSEWEVRRAHCIGNLVINERIDNFYFKGKRPAAHFAVSGFFLIQGDKIREWKDYRLPKEEA